MTDGRPFVISFPRRQRPRQKRDRRRPKRRRRALSFPLIARRRRTVLGPPGQRINSTGGSRLKSFSEDTWPARITESIAVRKATTHIYA
jgi:hypothetical protein